MDGPLVRGSLQCGHLTVCKKEGTWHIKQTNQTHLWQKCPVSLYRRCRDLYLFRRWLANPKHEVDYRVASSPCSCSLPNFLAASYFTAAVQLLAQTLISEGPTAAQWFVLSFFFPVHLTDHVDFALPVFLRTSKVFWPPRLLRPWSSKKQHPLQISAIDSGGAGGARAPPEFRSSEKGQSLISAYWSLDFKYPKPIEHLKKL